MITKLVLASLAAMGFSVAPRHDDEIAEARRRVSVVARWNTRSARRLQSSALDAVDRNHLGIAPAPMFFDADQTRETLAAVAERLK